MNIYINPLSDKGAPVLQTKPSGSPISQLRFKRGSSVPLTVTLLGVAEVQMACASALKRTGVERF